MLRFYNKSETYLFFKEKNKFGLKSLKHLSKQFYKKKNEMKNINKKVPFIFFDI